MTGRLRQQPCHACGKPHWFRHWVGQFCAQSSQGLNVADFDLLLHRFKWIDDPLGRRNVEHMMVVEVKVGSEQLAKNQRDSFSLVASLMDQFIPVDGRPIGVKSKPGFIVPGEKKVVWHGVHLVRVPFARCNIGPFFWDNQAIDSHTLADVMSFRRDAKPPHNKLDIERRHKAATARQINESLFSLSVA